MNPRILIADDEEAPREQLRRLLGRLWPQAELVAACANGVDAWDEALAREPQVCFLDIRMPGLTGLQVAQRLAQLETPPAVVFVTAYNDHALAAFEAGAVDYLVKPLDEERLRQTLGRLQARLQQPPAAPGPELQALLQQLLPAARGQFGRPIQASVGKEVRLIPPEDIVYFESDARYTRVVYRNQGEDAEALIRTPLKELIAQLDPEQFWQVHRSVLVNSRCVQSALRIDENNMQLQLRGRSERLPVSRQFQGLFKGQ